MKRRVSMRTWIAGALLLAGCSSVNFEHDVDRASALVESRSGLKTAWREEQGPPAWDGRSPLGATQAATVALQNNRELRAELEQIAAARADLVQAGLLPNPIVSLAFRLPLQGGNATFDAGFIQQFTDLWLRPYRKGAAQAQLERIVMSASDRALRTVADVRQAYLRVLYTSRGLELTRANIALVQQAIEATEHRVLAGEASRLDVNRVRQLLLLQQAELMRDEIELDKRRRELLSRMGLAQGSADWTLAGESSPQATTPIAIALSETDVMELAQRQRLDVVAARYIVEARREELGLASRTGRPTLGGGAQLEFQDGKGELGPAVEVGLPIFDTGRARQAKAAAELRSAQALAEQAEQQAIAQTRSAWLDVKQARDLAAAYREQVVALAEQNLSLAQSAIKSGTADQTVLLEAQRELITARRALNDFEAQRSVAEVELEYAVGGILRQPGEHEPP